MTTSAWFTLFLLAEVLLVGVFTHSLLKKKEMKNILHTIIVLLTLVLLGQVIREIIVKNMTLVRIFVLVSLFAAVSIIAMLYNEYALHDEDENPINEEDNTQI